MKIAFISDVHGRWNSLQIPSCDVLISCGDYSFTGATSEVEEFHAWLNEQPASHIISVQGNHELGVMAHFHQMRDIAKRQCPDVHFIEEGLVEVTGLKIWCSAITPTYGRWAYMRNRGPDIRRHWDFIPDNTDILVTHGPPYGVLDIVPDGSSVGCRDLLDAVMSRPSVKVHAFGHVHHSNGMELRDDKVFLNCAVVDEAYKLTRGPKIVEMVEKSIICVNG